MYTNWKTHLLFCGLCPRSLIMGGTEPCHQGSCSFAKDTSQCVGFTPCWHSCMSVLKSKSFLSSVYAVRTILLFVIIMHPWCIGCIPCVREVSLTDARSPWCPGWCPSGWGSLPARWGSLLARRALSACCMMIGPCVTSTLCLLLL